MFVYQGSLATPGNLTTNATPNTENDAFCVKAGARNVALLSVQFQGKGAGLNAISGIVARFTRFLTASTSGTSIALNAVDPGIQAATSTAFSSPTAGSSRSNTFITGAGSCGPGGFVSENALAGMALQGSTVSSLDMLVAAGTASLNYEFSLKVTE